MGSFSKNVALLSLGFWLGCAIFFAAFVAPTLFNSSVVGGPTSIEPHAGSGLGTEVAGSIAGALLRRIYLITYISVGAATIFLIFVMMGEAKGSSGPKRAFIACILVLLLNAGNDLWIHDKINKIKVARANAVGAHKADYQKDFDHWHKISTWVYGGTVLVGALGTLFLLPTVSGGKSKKLKPSK